MTRPIKISNLSLRKNGYNTQEYIRDLDNDIKQLYEKFKSFISFNKLYVGSDTGNTLIDSDGSLTFQGSATMWDDMLINISNARLPASNAPSYVSYKDTEILAFAKDATNIVYFDMQLSHSYKTGSNLSFHIHISHPDTTTGSSLWMFTYSMADINGVFPTATSSTALVAAPGTADVHQLVTFSAITSTSSGVSAIALCSISRIGGDTSDKYDNNIYLLSSDFHYEKDSIGSRQLYIK